MTDRITNLPASVHQRLLNIARREGVDLEYLLVRDTNERFLYRLSHSKARDQSCAQGRAMVFIVQGPEVTRQSRAVDLLGLGPMTEAQLDGIVRMLCELDVEVTACASTPTAFACRRSGSRRTTAACVSG